MGTPRNNQSDSPFDETVISPRFDQKAISGARRVVPIADEQEEKTAFAATRSFNQPPASSPGFFSKPSWPLALALTLALAAIVTGAVKVHRQSSSPSQSQYKEHVSAAASIVIEGEAEEGAGSTGRSESRGQRPGNRARNDYGRAGYYNALPPGKVELNERRIEDRGKYGKGESRGEEKRAYKEDRWRDREKERGKGRRGKGGD